MKSKAFRLLALFVILAMFLAPINGQPVKAVVGPTTDEPVAESSSAAPVVAKGVIGGVSETGLYIVQLKDASLAAYKGGIPSLAPTSPEVTGARKLDVKTPESQAYLSYLEARQSEFIAQMESVLGRAVEVTFQYRNVLNALAVRLSLEEAQRISRLEGVKAVFADKVREMDTDVGPIWIGAPAIWEGNTGSGLATQGEGVIIGMIDSGINHAHPAFADVGGDGYDHTNPYGSGNYVGWCVANPSFCNDKLIGAYGLNPVGGDPEDTDGHGSHTASTAGGNRHDAVFMVGTTTFTRTIQGVAPHANIIAYKVCNPTCPGSASIAAVNYAIGDGVDVLNYSISGTDDPWNDPVDLAFLDAFAAGIFVSASAGNSGPGAGTVAKTGPWNATVGASTHGRIFANLLDVTAPAPVPPELIGLAAVQGTGPALTAPLTDNITYDPTNLTGCTAFPAGFFSGQLALIQRGGCTFLTKVTNAFNAGAVGVVVFNNVGGPPIVMGGLEGTPIPSVMLGLNDGLDVKAWIDANPGVAEVTIDDAVSVVEDPDFADIMAGFSSRGPSQFDLLKPDFIAPGVNILAAVAASGGDPVQYGLYQGTSMSSPHGAGAGALMVALHPDWSPVEIKSALASSAYNGTDILKENATTPADPHDKGSGRLALGGAAAVGLVWDETYDNFVAANPAIGGEPKTLNLSTMTSTACVGNCSWTRTVKSVLPFPATYTATFTSTMGIVGTVSPITFTLPAGGTQELTITADVTGLPLDVWAFGYVMLETNAQWGGSRAVNGSYSFTSSPALPIPDNLYNGTPATMACDVIDASSIPAGEQVSNVTLQTAMSHTWIGDMVTKLFSPDGSVLGVFSRPGYAETADDGTGCCGDSTNMATSSPLGFADSYTDNPELMGNTLTTTQVVCQDDGRCTYYANPGAVVGLSNFAGFNGKNASGNWTFCVGDSAAGDTGTLGSWTLNIETTSAVSLPVTDQHMTLSVLPKASNVPDLVSIDTDKKIGTQMLTGLQVAEEITDLTVQVDGMNKASVYKPQVPEDPTNGDPFNGDGTFFATLDVPAGALRLVAQVFESTSLDVDLFVGTGSTPSAGTVVCQSATSAVLEYCNIDNPAPGTYWALVQNWQGSGAPTDLIALALGAVTPGDAGNLTVTGPATVPPGGVFDLALNWSIPDLADDDVYFGVFSVGTDPGNPGNLGSVDVNFHYSQPIFITKSGPETAQPGDVINYSIVLEGVGPIDGSAMLTDTLPAGIEFSGNLTATFGTAIYDEETNSIYWNNGVMPPLESKPEAKSQAPRSVALVVDSAPAEGTVAAVDMPSDAVSLVLDDGTVERAIGLNSDTASFQFLWFNRFTPAPSEFPFQLNQIDIFFTADSNAVVGDVIDLVVYEDVDGDPSNGADWLKTYPVTIQVVPGLNSYDISSDPVVFNGPGDVFIGAIDRWVVSGVTPPNFPAAQDSTLSQQRSWVASWLADPPDPALLPSDDIYNLIDDFGLGGNWIIRGYGETVSFMPEVITITFDATVTAAPGEEVTNVVELVYDGDPFSAETTFRVPVAYLEVAHLAPFAADPGTAVTVTLNGTPALTDFSFADSTGYIPLPPGDYDVAIYPAGSPDPAIEGSVSLLDGGYYSAIAVGDGVNQSLGLLALADDNTPPAAGTFHLRLGHLAPFASGDALADVRLQDGTVVLDDVAFGDVTGYLPLPAGEYDLKITSPDGSITYIDPQPVTFNDGDIFSAFAVGDGVNQPLGVFAWPAGAPGFLLPLEGPPVEYGVELTPAQAAQSGTPGSTVMYSLELTNTGNSTNTFTAAFAGNTWDVQLMETSFELGAGESAELVVHVLIPADAADGATDTVTIEVSGEGDVVATSELTTTAVYPRIYLPVVPQGYNAP